MKRLLITLSLVVIILAGCGSADATPNPHAIADAVAATVAAMPVPAPQQVEVTRVVEATKLVEVEVTRIVEATTIVVATPTATPEPPEGQDPASLIKYPDADASQDEAGLTLSVTGVSIIPLVDMPADFQKEISNFDYWDSVATVIALSVAVTNTNELTFNVYPNQGTLIAGNQQVDADIWTSDDVGGEIFSGVTKTGLVIFGLPNPVDIGTLDSLRYIVNGASSNDFTTHTDDFDMTIALPVN